MKTKKKFTEKEMQQVAYLAQAGATQKQIAAFLQMSFRGLRERKDILVIIRKERRKGDAKLLMKQYELAIKGSERLLMFLGVNRLNQKSKADPEQITQHLTAHYSVIQKLDGSEIRMMTQYLPKDDERVINPEENGRNSENT